MARFAGRSLGGMSTGWAESGPFAPAASRVERRYLRVVVSPERPWRSLVYISRGVLRFTGQARGVLSRAEQETVRLGHNYLGTEHILLGLVRGGENNTGSRVLQTLGVSLEAVGQQVEEIIGLGQGQRGSMFRPRPPLTPRGFRVLQLARREALQLGHDYIGSEHIVLGLVAEGEGVAAQVLIRLGANLKRVRQQVRQLSFGGVDGERSSLDILGRLESIETRLSALGLPEDDPTDSLNAD
jgi:ATP-dependent Clp protease ATP-binding subunit ClpA